MPEASQPPCAQAARSEPTSCVTRASYAAKSAGERRARHSPLPPLRKKARTVRFEVVLQASSADEPIVLRTVDDPNAATLAFHAESDAPDDPAGDRRADHAEARECPPHLAPAPREPLQHPERIRCR